MTVFIFPEQIAEEKRENRPAILRLDIVRALVGAGMGVGLASVIASIVVAAYVS